MQNERVLKVGEISTRPTRHPRTIKFHPKISLSGKWLEDLGFSIGDFISVVTTDNYIQIVKHQTEQMKKEAGNV